MKRFLAALAGVTPYIAVRLRRRPLPARGRYVYLLPMALIADLVEIAVLLEASVRYGALVL